jgi:CRISPR/Cas system-associated endonuclease Cas1
MAASLTVPQSRRTSKSPINKSGILTLDGFGVRVRMQSGHLEIEDGVGPERRRIRLARVGHGLKRLVLIGSDGFVTLEALRWLADQDAAFVMLDRSGSVLVTTGPVYPSDVRLRRAQALATHKLHAPYNADAIRCYRSELAEADSVDSVRSIESGAAIAYWSAWRSLPVTFPRKDEQRMPDHWRMFGARRSPLTNSPRLAVNPPNAMLNYLYAVLESEASLAAANLVA